MITFQESKELSEFSEVQAPEIAEDILERYNMMTPEGIKWALQQAAYAGFCAGKGYSDYTK